MKVGRFNCVGRQRPNRDAVTANEIRERQSLIEECQNVRMAKVELEQQFSQLRADQRAGSEFMRTERDEITRLRSESVVADLATGPSGETKVYVDNAALSLLSRNGALRPLSIRLRLSRRRVK